MHQKHILICDDDLKRYPPIISIINVLLSLNVKVTFLGFCSDELLIANLKNKGLDYQNITVDKVQTNNLKKFFTMFSNTREVKRYLREVNSQNQAIVWVFGNENGWRLNSIVKKYKSILYLFEFPMLKVPMKYRMVVPFFNLKKSIQSAWKVVCCEYNRAQITKSYFDLDTLPTIVPNKPFITDESADIAAIAQFLSEEEIEIIKNKKVVLYQGGINSERRIDLLCESIAYLNDDFVICIMGSDCRDKKILMEKYKNERIIFLPFISPPSHLSVTKLAYIGVLSYHTSNPKIEAALNFLYCAPNKIFEYSKFGIPMLSNDLPALRKDFSEFNSGICCNEFTGVEIAKQINYLSENYEKFSQGASAYYESVDIEEIIKELIS